MKAYSLVTFFSLDGDKQLFQVCDFLSEFHKHLVRFKLFLLHFCVYYYLRFLVKFYLNVLFYVSGLVNCDPIRSRSYLPSPKELKTKQGCQNIKNNDQKCFL